MKRKTSLIAATLSLSAISCALLVSAGNSVRFGLASNGKEEWNHYSYVAPTLDNAGIKEYWVSCSDPSHTIRFTAPTGENVVITDKGAPSVAFIDSLASDDTRLLPKYERTYSFEDGNVPAILSENKGNTVAVVNTATTDGSKALKVTTTGSQLLLTFERAWLDAIFTQEGAEEIRFDIKATTAAKDFYYNSITNQWGVGRYEPELTLDNAGVTTYWKTASFTKSMYQDLKADNTVIRIDNTVVGNEVYIDNIRYGGNNAIVSFEHNSIKAAGGTDSYIRSNITGGNEALFNAPNTTIELSDKYASDGASSLHIKSNEKNQFNLYVPYSHYASLANGLFLDLYIPAGTTDVMHIYPVDGVLPHGYVNDDNFGKWTTLYIPGETLQTEGTNWVRILGNRTSNTYDFYVDNVRAAGSTTIDFENDVDINAVNRIIFNNGGNAQSISNEVARTGKSSFKVTTTAAHSQALNISDNLYDSIPETGGIKFYLYSNEQFNFGIDGAGDLHYYNPVRVWKEYILPKANIDATAGRHYVFLPRVGVTVYVDDLSVVSTMPVSETLNADVLGLTADDTWF
jgi:hypothetical protein